MVEFFSAQGTRVIVYTYTCTHIYAQVKTIVELNRTPFTPIQQYNHIISTSHTTIILYKHRFYSWATEITPYMYFPDGSQQCLGWLYSSLDAP